jgi:V/A-type H+-transporting ATPase subunit I
MTAITAGTGSTMALRPAQAKWFETYVPHEQTVHALQVLAGTGVVQLETEPHTGEIPDLARLRFFLDRFSALARSHEADLPAGCNQPSAIVGNATRIANQALHRLRAWSTQVQRVQAQLDELRAERDQLLLLAECLEAMRPSGIDGEAVLHETRFLCKCLFVCQRGQTLAPEFTGVVQHVAHSLSHSFYFFVGSPEQRDLVRRLVVEAQCEQIGIPAWLNDESTDPKYLLLAQLRLKSHTIDELDSQLRALRKSPEMAEARANAETLRWYIEHAAHTLAERRLCHIAGWTTSADPKLLQKALHQAGIEAMLRFPAAPKSRAAPVALLNAWWTRPFQPLLQMWGTPGGAEVDPSGLLAVVVPLLFGYMFPDVGHGLMLLLFAAVFSRRWPQIRFLLPCGASAMFFGLVFGDLFGYEDVIPALWLKPLDAPLAVLAVPLVFGALLMLAGQAFSGVASAWHGELRRWLWQDGAVLLLYAATLASLFWPPAMWLVGAALLLYFFGSLMLERTARALPSAFGSLLLSAFELALNTLSFARVGAFALGHAALSQAILTLAATVEQPLVVALVLLLGNLFSLVLEGLVVYVQTTRLVLFEFFTRFLHEEGKLFRPLRRNG